MAPLEPPVLVGVDHREGVLPLVLASLAAHPNRFQKHAQGALHFRARRTPRGGGLKPPTLKLGALPDAHPLQKADVSPSASSSALTSTDDGAGEEEEEAYEEKQDEEQPGSCPARNESVGNIRAQRALARGITCDPLLREALEPNGEATCAADEGEVIAPPDGTFTAPAPVEPTPGAPAITPPVKANSFSDDRDAKRLQHSAGPDCGFSPRCRTDHLRATRRLLDSELSKGKSETSTTCSSPTQKPGTPRASGEVEPHATAKVTSASVLMAAAEMMSEQMETVVAEAIDENLGNVLRRERAGTCEAHSSWPDSIVELQHRGPFHVAMDEWPSDVRELLAGSARQVAAMANGAYGTKGPASYVPAVENLRLFSAVHSIPHPEKAETGGADSFFVDGHGEGVGIADGVGEWEWRFKINARKFADELMNGCQKTIESSRGITLQLASQRAMDALQNGYRRARSFGSSTALVATLSSESSRLGVVNLGDSTLLVLRRREVDPFMGLRCVGRTKEQQHIFNCPYQLSRLPTPEDFPALIQQGKERLVRAVRQKPNAKLDLPEDADRYSFSVQEGDLLVLGTDGVFDNLYLHEICKLASQAISPAEVSAAGMAACEPSSQLRATDPHRIAHAVAKAAYHRSLDRGAKTPFGDHARQAGMYHMGGKMDDITCLCAWVQRR